MENEKVIASVAGTMERVNKLVSVRPLRSKCVLSYITLRLLCGAGISSDALQNRYRPEVGDLVVGRIVEVRIPVG